LKKEMRSPGFAAPHNRGVRRMKKFILPALLAAAVGFAFLPSQAQAGGFSISISPGGYYAPVYSNYYTPPVYYAPSYYAPSYYGGASYYPYGYGGYGYSPYHGHEWHEHQEHEWHEHNEHHGHGGFEHHRH
jgi:hypothetical protein